MSPKDSAVAIHTGSNSRLVSIPRKATRGARVGGSELVAIPFDRKAFNIGPLSRSKSIRTIEIPRGITARVNDQNQEISSQARKLPIVVKRSSGATFSIKQGQIAIEADISTGSATAASMHLLTLEKDVLAALTYVQGQPHPSDAGIRNNS